jgi:hypothetical protein
MIEKKWICLDVNQEQNEHIFIATFMPQHITQWGKGRPATHISMMNL